MGEAGGGLLGNWPAKILHGRAGETSPPAFAAPYLRNISRSIFVFCFERDPQGLYSLPFQKAKVIQKHEKRGEFFDTNSFLFVFSSWFFLQAL